MKKLKLPNNGHAYEDFVIEKTKEKLNIKKRILFWSFPTILVIDFKRFNNKFQKNI